MALRYYLKIGESCDRIGVAYFTMTIFTESNGLNPLVARPISISGMIANQYAKKTIVFKNEWPRRNQHESISQPPASS